MSSYVFAYGTLRKGECNHEQLQGARLIAAQAKTKGELYDTHKGYPMLDISNKGFVYGEVYEVCDPKQWERLDELEGYIEHEHPQNEYHRTIQTVYTDCGPVEAVVYTTGSNRGLLKEKIPLGDWRIWKANLSESIYYFAYGSCMDHDRFIKHGVDQHFTNCLGKGTLSGYSLRYTHITDDGGRADMVEEGGIVEGKLYQVSREAVDYLYAREGVHSEKYRPALISVEHKGRMLDDVLTFFVVNKQPETAPPDHYATELIRGSTGSLSDSYVKKLQEQVVELKQAQATMKK
ncbi:gamma-glutamylcyclotransferase [Priestia megaterium]|nr:gamma-glutamylcyclotransferase [Priestia megaterium]